MPTRDEKQALAKKRTDYAEMARMLQEQSQEAKLALQKEYASFIEYLQAFEGITEPQRVFLAHLLVTGMPYRAAFDSQIQPALYYRWLKQSEEFRTLVDECKKLAADRLERVAIALATGEYMKPLVSQGRIAAYEPIYDTRALITLLKARKPEQFQQRIDVTSNGHSLVKLVSDTAWDAV